MSTYLIGDIHGCYKELRALLKQCNFNPKFDTLWLTGDLVARGPNSIDVLRYVKSLGKSVRLVLGNHDIHLLSIYADIQNNNKPTKYFASLFNAYDIDELMYWLRNQPLLQCDEEKKIMMCHAGITHKWDCLTTKKCAREIENSLTNDNNYKIFLKEMHGDMPNNWTEKLTGFARLRFIINVLTRMRFCFLNGELNLIYKGKPNSTLPLKPWFEFTIPVAKKYTIIFGHWSLLKGQGIPKGIIGLDTGCCWGNKLTMLHWEEKRFYVQKSFL